MADSDFEILDERFRTCVKLSARVEQLFEGCRWAEGPAYFPAHRTLVWSDIPNDRMLRLDECSGGVSVFRSPASYANGNTVDQQGRLVTAEHGGRRVTRTEHSGEITVLADRWRGKRLNSPNDVVVRADDGSIWFTDPPYGIDSNYEGIQAESEIGASYLFRLDAASGALSVAADDFARPNGLAFSPDGSRLYVADTGGTHVPDGPRHMRMFDVADDGSLSGGSVFATCEAGFFDGFRFDDQGRIWTSTAEGVHCYHPDGQLLGKIRVPERVANVCFGGPKRNRLYICATTSLYAVYLPVNGACIL